MRFNVLTLFPQMFEPLNLSMLGRAQERELVEINLIDPREYSENKHRKVDDYSFGGGPGMVMMPQPLMSAMEAIDYRGKVIYMSPRGTVLNEDKLKELAGFDTLTILCGHYEGIDQRVLDKYQVEEVSIGDYILTGGEPAALVLIDALSRLIPGVLASDESIFEESIYSGLLEHPQYTQPREYEGVMVPEILLSGNHKAIDDWRFEQRLSITKKNRPDLFEKYLKEEKKLDKQQNKILEKILKML